MVSIFVEISVLQYETAATGKNVLAAARFTMHKCTLGWNRIGSDTTREV
jgi:hypothetical protein